jgi:hypothetical protein
VLSRPATPYEKLFFQTHEVIQFGVQLSHSRFVDSYVNNLVKSISALHIRTDGTNFYSLAEPAPIFQMPQSVRSARDAAYWADAHLKLPFSDRMGAVGVRDDLVAVSVSHSCIDGVSFLHLFKGKPVESSTFPVSLDSLLADEMSRIPDSQAARHAANGARLTRVPWSSSVDTTGGYCKYIWGESPPEKFRSFDSKSGKLKQLTEFLWTSLILTFVAVNGSYDKLGCTTCVDVRPYCDCAHSPVGNRFVSIAVLSDRTNDDTITVSDLGRRLRKDFSEKIRTRYFAATLKGSADHFVMTSDRTAFTDLSSVGVFKLPELVADLWIQQTMLSNASEGMLPFICYSVAGKERTKVGTRLHYSPTAVNARDANRIFKSVMHSLETIPASATLREAVDELRRFQRRESF